MSGLPVISGQKAVKAFSKLGYYYHSQHGSHVKLKHGSKPTLVIPLHDELDRGTLRALIKAAELTVDEFVELL